jgi:hypothetical protein
MGAMAEPAVSSVFIVYPLRGLERSDRRKVNYILAVLAVAVIFGSQH